MNNRAVALVTVLIIVFVLFTIVGGFLYLVSNARSLNERYYENLTALALAEAGVDFAVWEINFSSGDFLAAEGWSGVNPKTKTITDFQDAYGTVYGNINISVYDPGTSSPVIISEGSLSSITGPTVKRTIRVVLKEHKIFDYAILTAETIALSGTQNKIDSYDSSLGSYGGTNVGQEGDLITNGQVDPAITIAGGATVDGDAVTGPGGTVSITGTASVSGTTDDTAEIYMPSVVVPTSLTSLTSAGPLVLSGQNSLELTTGKYKYDYMDLSGQSTLTFNGDVDLYFTQSPSITTAAQSQIIITSGGANIYFDGDVSISGQGISNQGGDPSDLTFYGTDSVTNINLAGIGMFYGTFYAPEADYFFISGNSEVYGAVVGKNVVLTGTATVHYDENLKVDAPSLGYDPYVWQEK